MQPPMRRNPMQGNRMPMPGPPRPKGMQSYAANGKKPAVGRHRTLAVQERYSPLTRWVITKTRTPVVCASTTTRAGIARSRSNR